MSNVACPNCGENYYVEKYSTRTAMYYPAVWKNGVNENPDGNVTTTYCECLNCHYDFCYKEQYGKVLGVTLGAKVTPVTSTLSGAITATQRDMREAEIQRLEKEIESLKNQLAEVKANPDWRQGVYI